MCIQKLQCHHKWLNPLLIRQFKKDIANIAKKPHIFAKQGTTDGEVLNRLLFNTLVGDFEFEFSFSKFDILRHLYEIFVPECPEISWRKICYRSM